MLSHGTTALCQQRHAWLGIRGIWGGAVPVVPVPPLCPAQRPLQPQHVVLSPPGLLVAGSWGGFDVCSSTTCGTQVSLGGSQDLGSLLGQGSGEVLGWCRYAPVPEGSPPCRDGHPGVTGDTRPCARVCDMASAAWPCPVTHKTQGPTGSHGGGQSF